MRDANPKTVKLAAGTHQPPQPYLLSAASAAGEAPARHGRVTAVALCGGSCESKCIFGDSPLADCGMPCKKSTFDLQSAAEKMFRFNEKLRNRNSMATYPNILGAAIRDATEKRKRREREAGWH